ncbi:hypothetical protein [Jongsikchunia kroppenstedtii]|uniref:hypothetical protein n=1 Tax=Jongsikchunia kroppenstedtii TaxID=1121721 RepID=UPI003F86DE7A
MRPKTAPAASSPMTIGMVSRLGTASSGPASPSTTTSANVSNDIFIACHRQPADTREISQGD